MAQKLNATKSRKVLNEAKGKDCTLNIVGVCNYDPSTTVAAHLPDETHGLALKADDVAAVCWACSNCHDVIDGRAKWPENEKPHEDMYLLRALQRTIRGLFNVGRLKVA